MFLGECFFLVFNKTYSDPEVKATAFVKTDSILISVGNFSESDRNVHLIIDWNSLGMDKTKALLKAPFVNDFQQASTFSFDGLST